MDPRLKHDGQGAAAERAVSSPPPDTSASIVDFILKIGSVAGLVSIFYQIQQNRRSRPSFTFTFEGSRAAVERRDHLDFCNYYFSGILRNASLTPNTIVRLYLVVWGNEKKTPFLRYGHIVKGIKNIGTGEAMHLPLRLDARGVVRVEVNFEFPLTGTSDERIMTSFVEEKVGDIVVRRSKHQYEFTVEDAAGNEFDWGGKLMSRKLLNLWWLLPNDEGKPRQKGLQFDGIGRACLG